MCTPSTFSSIRAKLMENFKRITNERVVRSVNKMANDSSGNAFVPDCLTPTNSGPDEIDRELPYQVTLSTTEVLFSISKVYFTIFLLSTFRKFSSSSLFSAVQEFLKELNIGTWTFKVLPLKWPREHFHTTIFPTITAVQRLATFWVLKFWAVVPRESWVGWSCEVFTLPLLFAYCQPRLPLHHSASSEAHYSIGARRERWKGKSRPVEREEKGKREDFTRPPWKRAALSDEVARTRM